MLERDEVQRLMDVAFLGFQTGRGKPAWDIVGGLDRIMAESVELELCRAMGFYTLDCFEKARQVLDNARERFPDSSMVMVYLALVDILEEKFPDARDKVDRVIGKGDDEAAVRLGKTLLREMI